MKFLHVGCGPTNKNNTTRGFSQSKWEEIRFDIDDSVEPDVVGTMTNMENIADSSVAAIYSSHNIEHLYAHEVSIALGEFHRVLEDTGFAVITCPDLQSICKLVADNKLLETAYTSPAGPIAAIDMIYGHRYSLKQGNHFMAHKVGFTLGVLSDLLKIAGFKTVAGMRREKYFDLFIIACKNEVRTARIKELARDHFP